MEIQKLHHQITLQQWYDVVKELGMGGDEFSKALLGSGFALHEGKVLPVEEVEIELQKESFNTFKHIDEIADIIHEGIPLDGKCINTGVIQLSGDAKAECIFSEREIIKNFITEIQDDIESIDCGCSDCIGSFISGVNTVIEKYGLELKPNGERSVCSLGLDLIDL